jgi:hypothetical protein
VDVQLAAVRLDAGAEGPLVERPEVVGDGAHGVCDGGRPESSSPGAMKRLEERCRNRGCFIAQSSTARPSGASAQRHHHGPSIAGKAVRPTAAAVLTRRSARLVAIAFHGGCCIKPSRKSCCTIAEIVARATGCDDLGTDAPRVTDEMADFGTHA